MDEDDVWAKKQMATLERILERLDGVTSVSIFGTHVAPDMFQLLLAFCSRCPNGHVQDLNLNGIIDIPLTVLLQIFSCTRRLVIDHGDVAAEGETALPSDNNPPSILTDLLLMGTYSDFDAFLALPRSLPHFPALERLCFPLAPDTQTILCHACAQTLQWLDVECDDMSDEESISVVFPPDMPSLRAMTFYLAFEAQSSTTWLPNTLSALLADTRAPQLASIEFSAACMSAAPAPWGSITPEALLLTLREAWLPHLDGLLARHPARPAVRWTLRILMTDQKTRAEFIESLAQRVRRGMPKANEAGRLHFDRS
ncbi:hypothetical protein C8F01DRAFT_1171290 [Mycena amicta]|nr:hypothetical protein C8F01DRAFT_1171290 [Mycena amicta]